jgi:agmatine/peptidylarginine deiminase
MEKFLINPKVYRNRRNFILEGGSLETDGEGTLLTTSKCLLSQNRNGGLSKKDAGNLISEELGVEHILWLDYGALMGDDTDSHIDTLCRIAPNNTILFTGCRNVDDPQFEELLKMRAQLTMFRDMNGEPFNLIELPLPDPIYDEDGERLPATYANYLITPRSIFVPTYDQPQNDMLAMHTLKVAFPKHNIVPVDCRTLIKQHGSLHCSTMQLPSNLVSLLRN